MSAYRDSLERLLDFYGSGHWGDLYGATRGRPNPHRGLDINEHPEGTWIPSIIGGSVVRSEYQGGLGHVVTVAGGGPWAGRMISYCHLASAGPPIGTNINFAEGVGPLGNTGTLSQGAHLHLVSITDATTNPATSPVENPMPRVLAAGSLARSELANTAGGGTVTPINPTPGEEDDMTPAQAQSLADVQSTVVALSAAVDQINAILVETQRRLTQDTPSAVAAATWNTNINRSSGPVKAIQELANIRTHQINNP